tara:strand:- start:193 stop:1650 length:1458 start_codon:yes stop_codon:yes gene_type:complete
LIKDIFKNNEIVPVILSGGLGSRLWPLSRESFPKQYLNLQKENDYTLLQETYLRLKGLKNLSKPIIICNEEHRFIVAEQMREIEVSPHKIILEPISRNTAPAIALSALIANEGNNDPFLLILSADHKIESDDKFRKTIEDGISLASNGRLITFGIVPNTPETGYGYIKSKKEITLLNRSSEIEEFIEKPNKEKAKALVKDKFYLWNSGIFLFKASVILQELIKFEPQMVDYCKRSIKNIQFDLDFCRLPKDEFGKCKNIPIDIAVMEKTNIGSVITLDTNWSDIGDWNAVWKNSNKDKNGNTLIGKNIVKSTQNCYLRGGKRVIAGVGINNLVVVDTEDALLIAHKEYSQKVKEIVTYLKKNNITEGSFHKQMYRPWGNYKSVIKGETWQVKRLVILPKASLSLQSHKHRSEHWVVVDGQAKIEINGQESFLNKNESIYVPLGSKHRLSNPTQELLVIIEVQSGDYLGEDDIERFEDNYGRVNNL